MNKSPFIDRIQNMRRTFGLSSKQMAIIMGIDYQTYDYWEAGLRKPNKIVHRYLDLLDMIKIFHPDTFERFKKSALGEI